ncbi:MAG TPA: hypothetical protein PL064_09550 [Thermogutta sp.]|nr:hypothetical protein [Thermogutta sp.]
MLSLNKNKDVTICFIDSYTTPMKSWDCDCNFLLPGLPTILASTTTNRLTSPYGENCPFFGDNNIRKSLSAEQNLFLKIRLSQKRIERAIGDLLVRHNWLSRILSERFAISSEKQDTAKRDMPNNLNHNSSHMFDLK